MGQERDERVVSGPSLSLVEGIVPDEAGTTPYRRPAPGVLSERQMRILGLIEALNANIESIRNLETNLRLQGDDPDRMPLVVQYNKRDLPNIIPVEDLSVALKVPNEVKEFEACAKTGMGVSDTLKAIVKDCLRLVADPRRAKEGRTPSILPGIRASMYPDSLPASLSEPPIPAPPKVPLMFEDDLVFSPDDPSKS